MLNVDTILARFTYQQATDHLVYTKPVEPIEESFDKVSVIKHSIESKV